MGNTRKEIESMASLSLAVSYSRFIVPLKEVKYENAKFTHGIKKIFIDGYINLFILI